MSVKIFNRIYSGTTNGRPSYINCRLVLVLGVSSSGYQKVNGAWRLCSSNIHTGINSRAGLFNDNKRHIKLPTGAILK